MNFRPGLRSFLVLVACSLLAGCGGQGSDSPEQAIKRYTKAYVRADRKALERSYWISDNEEARDAVIGNILAMKAYNSSLRKNVPDALDTLIKRGQVADYRPPEVPRDRVIRKAVEESFDRDSTENERFTVFLPEWSMLTVAKHQNRWYVEHPFSRIGREWKQNEIAYMNDVNELYVDAAEQIRKSTMARTDLGLTLELRQVYYQQQELMRKHDVNLVVHGLN